MNSEENIGISNYNKEIMHRYLEIGCCIVTYAVLAPCT